MSIAVCIPSRGLIHSRTMQDILANTIGEEVDWYFSHGHPIPESHNIIIEEALEDKPDYILIIEDDQQLPTGIISQLLLDGGDLVVADYPVRVNKHSVTYIGGVFQYAGLGCVLIRPSVFERLERPYFRVDTEYVMSPEGLTPTKATMGNHGLLDVDFYQRCIEIGIEPSVIEVTAGHYFLNKPELPKFGNDSALKYDVVTWRF